MATASHFNQWKCTFAVIPKYITYDAIYFVRSEADMLLRRRESFNFKTI